MQAALSPWGGERLAERLSVPGGADRGEPLDGGVSDCRKEVRSLYRLAGVSVAAMAVCVALVYLIVVRLSRRAMEPVVQSVQRQKQFITDAGHELKTPITVIATSLRLEMEVGQQKWLEKAQNQTERLKELVNSLVMLSRMDEEESPLKLSDFAVSEAVEETAESFRILPGLRAIRWSLLSCRGLPTAATSTPCGAGVYPAG